MTLAYSAVVSTTEALEDEFLFCFVLFFCCCYPNRSGNLITGDLIADRNVMLHFRMNVLLSLISSLVK